MGHENSALTSWLPQVGTAKRAIILKKLKRSLERRGMTRQEVYEGLLQLATTPQVSVTRWCVRDDRRSRTDRDRSANTTKSTQPVSSMKETPGDKARSKDSLAVVDDKKTISAEPRESSTPELLGEEVGTGSPFRAAIPRNAIKLNLKSYDSSRPRLGNDVHRRASTEISIADSSVIDDDDKHDGANGSATTTRRGSSGRAARVAHAKDDSRMKPKIIEDVTCVEGTILARMSLTNSSNSATESTSVTRLDDPTPVGKETTSAIVHFPNTLTSQRLPIVHLPKTAAKKRAMAVSFSGKKLRLRRKFRQIFGNDLTLSELEEEDDIVERFVRQRRKKRARSSLDSGVCLTDCNTNDILVEQRDDSPDLAEQRESLDEKRYAATMPEMSSNEEKVTSVVSETPSNSRECPEAHSLPDSSTSSVDEVVGVKTETSDTRLDEKTPKATGKLTIVVSPVNAEDAFVPVSLEIEMPCDGNTYRVTSPITSTEPTTEGVRSETIIVDCSRTGSSSADSAGVTVTIARDDPDRSTNTRISPVDETPSESDVSMSATRDLDQSMTGGNNEPTRNEGESNLVPMNNQGSNDGEANTLLPPPASFPKLRVLRPSELGSRWCPTPLNVPSSVAGSLDQPSVGGNSQRPTFVPDSPALPSSSVSRQSFDHVPTSTINSMNHPAQQTSFAAPAPSCSSSCIIMPNNSPVVYTIALLMSLDSCLQRYKSLYLQYDTATLQNEFVTKKSQLWRILGLLGLEMGIRDIGKILEYVMKHYEAALPPERRTFTREKVVNVMSIERLQPPSTRPSERAPQRYIPMAAAVRFPVRSSLPYPTPRNSFAYTTPVYSPRRVFPVADQCAYGETARRASNQSPSTIFTAQQLTILREQIVAYNVLIRLPRPQPTTNTARASASRQQKATKSNRAALPTESTTVRSSIIVSAEDVPLAATPLVRSAATRDETRISNSSVICQRKEAASRELSIDGGSSIDHRRPKLRSSTSVNVTDVLQAMARLSPLTSPNDNAMNDYRNNEATESRNKTRDEAQCGPSSPSQTTETPTFETIEETTETIANAETAMNKTSTENVEARIDETSPNNAEIAFTETSPNNAEIAFAETSPNFEATIDETTTDIAATPSDSQSSVLIMDDDDEPSSHETSNFSILDVKTITKDVFNNMGQSTAATPATPESSGQTNENADIPTTTSNPMGCLRCGEPCCVVCEQCYEAFYCSSECHEAHWTEHHYLTCKPVPAEALTRLRSGAPSPGETLYPNDVLDVEQTPS